MACLPNAHRTKKATDHKPQHASSEAILSLQETLKGLLRGSRASTKTKWLGGGVIARTTTATIKLARGVPHPVAEMRKTKDGVREITVVREANFRLFVRPLSWLRAWEADTTYAVMLTEPAADPEADYWKTTLLVYSDSTEPAVLLASYKGNSQKPVRLVRENDKESAGKIVAFAQSQLAARR